MYFASSWRMSSAVMTMTFGVLRVPVPHAVRLPRPAGREPTAGPSASPAPNAAVPLSRLRRLISESAAMAVQLHDERLTVHPTTWPERIHRRREVGGLRSSGDVNVPIGVDGDGATEVERGASDERRVAEPGAGRVQLRDEGVLLADVSFDGARPGVVGNSAEDVAPVTYAFPAVSTATPLPRSFPVTAEVGGVDELGSPRRPARATKASSPPWWWRSNARRVVGKSPDFVQPVTVRRRPRRGRSPAPGRAPCRRGTSMRAACDHRPRSSDDEDVLVAPAQRSYAFAVVGKSSDTVLPVTKTPVVSSSAIPVIASLHVTAEEGGELQAGAVGLQLHDEGIERIDLAVVRGVEALRRRREVGRSGAACDVRVTVSSTAMAAPKSPATSLPGSSVEYTRREPLALSLATQASSLACASGLNAPGVVGKSGDALPPLTYARPASSTAIESPASAPLPPR